MRIPACIAIFLIFFSQLSGQKNESKFTLDGYVTNMQSAIFTDAGGDWITDNLIHNRMNIHWYPSERFSGSLQLRNRFLFGETISGNPAYAGSIEGDNGLVDLSWNLLSGDSYMLNSSVDRLWLQYSSGKFVATAGRQRINWGQTFVWNANDIFNAYSYFDFDYPERPGSDAVRLQYYPNFTSVIETAVKADSSGKITAAGLYRFNVFSYDLQIIAGVLQQEDYLAGGGWSGIIGPVGFRGEGTFFYPVHNGSDTTGLFLASVGIDYTFNNSLFLQAEYLYSSNPMTRLSDLTGDFTGQLNVKQLAFIDHTLFLSLSYPVTPLLQITMAGMAFPGIKGGFAGPSLSFNAYENTDLGVFIQYFNAELPDPGGTGTSRQDLTLAYLRLKWNF